MPTTTLTPRVLAVRTIPIVTAPLAEALGLSDDQVAVGFLTVDQDDPTYVAIDEATKKAAVEVVPLVPSMAARLTHRAPRAARS